MTDFWAARPPEVNDFILRAGAGVGTTAAAAAKRHANFCHDAVRDRDDAEDE